MSSPRGSYCPLSATFLLRHKHPGAKVAWSWSQHSPHTGVAQCDCSHTLVSSFAQLYSHEANIPSRTARTSCKAPLSCGDSLEFPIEKSMLLPAQRQIITRQVSDALMS